MFEVVEQMKPRDRLVRGVRRMFSLERCIAMTRAQRLARALVWFVAGGVCAVQAAAWADREYPAPVKLLAPAIEHHGERFDIVRFGFEYRGVVSSCRVLLHHNDQHTWSVTC